MAAVEKSPVKEIREQLGISQVALSAASGISRTVISEVESGVHPIPRKLLDLLQRAHVNIDIVMEKQNQYMESKKQELLEKLKQVVMSHEIADK